VLRATNISVGLFLLGAALTGRAQVDPFERNQLQLGYDQPISGKGPLAGYLYYYLNNPKFAESNLTLRLALAPVYLDSEIGIKHFLTPSTDLGIGIAGGAYGDY